MTFKFFTFHRNAIALSTIGFLSGANAEWLPTGSNYSFDAVAYYGPGSIGYSETQAAAGPLGNVASSLRIIPYRLQTAINEVLRAKVTERGANLVYGILSGDLHIKIGGNGAGAAGVIIDGISYVARTEYYGRKFGISLRCTNTLSISNLSISALYAVSTGAVDPTASGITGKYESSTDCDSNLEWMLPVVGTYLINQLSGTLDNRIVTAINDAVTNTTQSLIYARDVNYLSGINRMIPPSTVVPLPDGGSFPLGQFIQNNTASVISSSSIDLTIKKGLVLTPKPNNFDPIRSRISAPLLSLKVQLGFAEPFGINLAESASVSWRWKCKANDPAAVCEIP